ncbi:MAG: FecR domain-containing protein [Henriciella sp.]|uniref:FecR family protein n=1 Tax=Henriciella sp. TaxID=1968823 RepID=UPI0032EF03DB
MNAENRLASAEPIEQAAANWLAQLDRHGLLAADSDLDRLAEDDREFANWLNKNTAHRVAFLRMLSTWRRAERLTVLRGAETTPRRTFVRRPIVQALAAAACVAMAVVGFTSLEVFGSRPEAPAPLRYQTAHGDIRTINLKDGSVLTLNTDTSITVAFSDKERQVDLFKGEVFFDVAPDPGRPFRIDAGDGQVEVLGTSFGVERREAGVEVAVSEGTVWLSNTGAAKQSASVLKPGMIGYASPDGLIVESSGLETVASRLLWRDGRLRFDNTPLTEAAAEFNRYNSTRLVIADEATGAIEIGGTFPVDNVEAFARLAEDGLGLEVRYSSRQIELSSK